jgi:hypothetical protein
MATTNIYDMADTWTVGGTTYTSIKMNVTDTASAAASLLMDLQVGGTSKFAVTKAGAIKYPGTSDQDWVIQNGDTVLRSANSNTMAYCTKNFGVTGFLRAYVDAGGGPHFEAQSSNGATTYFQLYGDAANVLAQRNSTNGQTFRVYNTYTDASNYERLSAAWSGNICTLKAEAAGTGTARALNAELAGVIGGTVTKTSAYTATASDFTIRVDASGGAVTITLPAAASHTGRLYRIKKVDGSANAVTIDGNAAETIDGAATQSTTTQYASFTIQSNGTNWDII